MTTDELNMLHDKAKSRKDGVYTYKGNFWAVKGGEFVAFIDFFGNCFQRMGAFNIRIGTVKRHERKKKLTAWLRSQ